MKLIIEDDDGRKTVVPFARDEISIGRRDGNTIRLTERNVSRRHARLTKSGAHVFLEDLGSYNGVKVNGDRVQGRAEIQEGDLIEIGDYNLAIQLDSADALSMIGIDDTEARKPGSDLDDQLERLEPSSDDSDPASNEAFTEAKTLPLQSALDKPLPDIEVEGPLEPDDDTQPSTISSDSGSVEDKVDRNSSREQGARDLSGRGLKQDTALIRVEVDALNRSSERHPLDSEDQPRLVVLSGEFAGLSHKIGHTSCSVGRTEENDLCIEHRSLSRRHCRVFVDEEGAWKILDRDSANGVRVNGEEYGLTELTTGDIITLGHIRIRFCSPNDPYVFSAADREKYAESDQLDEYDTPTERKSLTTVLVALGVVGAMVFAGFFFMGDILRSEESQIVDIRNEYLPPEASAEQAIQAGDEAMLDERWDDAIHAYQRAVDADPLNAIAKEALRQANEERVAENHYNELLASSAKGAWEEAWNAMAAIHPESIYAGPAQEHYNDILEGYSSLLLNDAQEALENAAWQTAIDLAEAVLTIAPDHRDAIQLRNKAVQGRDAEVREREAARLAEARRQKLADAKQIQQKVPRQKQPRKASSKLTTPEEPSTSQRLAREHYNRGARLVRQENYRDAVLELERALELDPRGQSVAHALLGTCHGQLGDMERAALHYRRFLETNPNHRQAPQVRGILEEFDRSRSQ